MPPGEKLAWFQMVQRLQPYVVRIATPGGMGTGWLVTRSKIDQSLCAIVTAAHVVEHAHDWGEPIRIVHKPSRGSMMLKVPDRAVLVDEARDSATIVFRCTKLNLPKDELTLVPPGKHVKPGVEIGWLGYPSVSARDLCFFAGRVSAYLVTKEAYLVDGVAINGVSGGPAFYDYDGLRLVGIVSAYIPNLATGDVLPGVALVRDVSHVHEAVERLRSLDEAKSQESEHLGPEEEENLP